MGKGCDYGDKSRTDAIMRMYGKKYMIMGDKWGIKCDLEDKWGIECDYRG